MALMASMFAKFTNSPKKHEVIVYTLFLASCLAMMHFIGDYEESLLPTLSGMAQCFAVVLLSFQWLQAGTSRGISMESLFLHILALCGRLSSTTWLQGYLPIDATGDWFIQAVDVFALVVASCLWLRIFAAEPFKTLKDVLRAFPVIIVCCILGYMFHGTADLRPIYDTLWLTGLFCHSAAALFQSRKLTLLTGPTQSFPASCKFAAQSINAMFMGQVMSAASLWQNPWDDAGVAVTYDNWLEGTKVTPWALSIFATHCLVMYALSDFADTATDLF